ncbi:unnamed protein product [Cuscuta campestris]|uniref:Uncharacterized protein n=1 Tax=Cuscuta campestris TaxID=132261 RepID=A0A484KU43_9ASTE|nr:unnamed protein product [Cuscuta campestris]
MVVDGIAGDKIENEEKVDENDINDDEYDRRDTVGDDRQCSSMGFADQETSGFPKIRSNTITFLSAAALSSAATPSCLSAAAPSSAPTSSSAVTMAPTTADPMDHLPTGLKLFVRNLQSLTPAKLDDSNFPSWSATIRANLMAHRLLGYVDGTEPAPPSLLLEEKAATSGKEDPPVMKANPAYETWLIVDAQIRACLLAIVSPTVQTHIHALPTSAAIWTHLEQRYNSLSRTYIFQLKERLHSLQKGSDSMQTYLDNVLNIVSSLTLAHEHISDQDVILCILRGLPADYSSLKQNIRTNIGNVNLNQVSAWLLSEELNINLERQLQITGSASSSSSEIHNALFTNSGRGNFRGRGRGGYRGRGSSRGRGAYGGRGSRPPGHQRDDHHGRGGPQPGSVTCQLCGKPGHAVWDSWHRFDESYSGPSQAYYTTQSTDINSNWHLDTGANAHVTSDLSRLQSSSPYQGTNSITTAGGKRHEGADPGGC